MIEITGMLISGKMSVAMLSSANGVASTISIAMTMNVYGRFSASWTIDIWVRERARRLVRAGEAVDDIQSRHHAVGAVLPAPAGFSHTPRPPAEITLPIRATLRRSIRCENAMATTPSTATRSAGSGDDSNESMTAVQKLREQADAVV